MLKSKMFLTLFACLFVFAFSTNAQDSMAEKEEMKNHTTMDKIAAKSKTINLEQTRTWFRIGTKRSI